MKKNIFQKRIYYLFFLIISFFLFSCSEENSTEPEKDKQNPIVSIISPVTNSVLTDTVTIRINATDNNNVTKVEFYIDNIHKVDADDINEPFEYFWNLGSSKIGNIHTLFVKAYDAAGNVGISDTIKIYYKGDYFPFIEGNHWEYDVYTYSGDSFGNGFKGQESWEIKEISSDSTFTLECITNGYKYILSGSQPVDTVYIDNDSTTLKLSIVNGFLIKKSCEGCEDNLSIFDILLEESIVKENFKLFGYSYKDDSLHIVNGEFDYGFEYILLYNVGIVQIKQYFFTGSPLHTIYEYNLIDFSVQ